MLFTLLSAVLVPPIVAKLSERGVTASSDGEDTLPVLKLWLVAQIGGLLAVAMVMAGASDFEGAVAAALLSFLAAGAFVDRETGWAPDHIVLPVCVLAMMSGAAQGAWLISPLLAAVIGVAVYLIVNVAWMGVAMISDAARALPPGDILALIVPIMALGFTKEFVTCMMLISSLLAIVILIPKFGNIVGKKEVCDCVRAEMGREGDCAPVVTFLTIGFPAAGIAIVANALV